MLSDWYARHYGWQLREEWLVRTPSVVYALFAAVKALTAPGEAVMILRPVYGAFYPLCGKDRAAAGDPCPAHPGRPL